MTIRDLYRGLKRSTQLGFWLPGQLGNRFVQKRLTWIFGAPRTGSTWLAQKLLASHARVKCWNESHFGLVLCQQRDGKQPGRRDYALADCHRRLWQPAMARFILDNIRGRYVLGRGDRLVMKEPNGGRNADLLMAALPHSRMIFLLRDPRDVLDSLLDLHRPDSWNPRPVLQSDEERLASIRSYLYGWMFQSSIVEEAYDQHAWELRLLVKYEELRANTLEQVRRVFDFIEVKAPTAWLESIIATHAFEALPQEEKGPGKFARAARPGQWRQSFSLAERRVIQEMLAPWLAKLGYAADEEAAAQPTMRIAA